MMGWTDRHCRYFLRQIAPPAVMFSEMLHPEAIVLGSNKRKYLRRHASENPVAFQLGGNEPAMLARATAEICRAGFDEVNLNVGCPSKKGLTDPFGAHLFKQPQRVRECLQAMGEASNVPVSVKTRIGVDDDEGYEPLAEFVGIVQESGCRIFYVHARKAWLKGLSTKANRQVPPLHYEHVHRLKREFPHLTVVINGGITEWHHARSQLQFVDGVMIGRRAYKDPFWLTLAERELFDSGAPLLDEPEILRRCIGYVQEETAGGTPVREILRHMVGLYRDVPAATAFRRHIALEAYRRDAGLHTYLQAVEIAEALQRRYGKVRLSSLSA